MTERTVAPAALCDPPLRFEPRRETRWLADRTCVPTNVNLQYNEGMLRDFIYLDQRLVNQFLAQLEGGLFDEETERRSQTGKGGFAGGVRAAVIEAKAEKTRETTTETERSTRQTPESQFNRLFDYLSKDDLISVSDVDEKPFVDGLKRGDLLHFEEAALEVSGFQQAAALAQQLSDLLPVMDLFGDVDIDDKTRAEMQAVGALANSAGPLPVIARIPGKAKLAIAMELDRQFLLDDVAGEASILVRVIKVLKKGESHLVGDPTGGLVSRAPRAQRRKMASGFDTKGARGLGINSPQIAYPAIIGTAIAIYR